MTFRTALMLGVALALAGAAVRGADADTAARGPLFSIRPVTWDPAVPASDSYFVLNVKSGRTIRNEFRISNVGGAAGSALVYPVDATTGQTSGAVYFSRSAPRRDVGAWLHLPVRKVDLAPGETRVVPFETVVPAHARGGVHVGGIVAEDATQTAAGTTRGGGSIGIKLRFLTVVAVEVDLPGPNVARLEIGGIKADRVPSYQRVLVDLRNTGNLLEKPQLALTITTPGGRILVRRVVQLDSVLPQTRIDYPIYLTRVGLPPGSYTARIALRYGRTGLTRFTGQFSVSRR